MKRARLVERATRQDAAEAEFLRVQSERRQLDLRTAKLLARIDGAGHFVFRGCSSIAQYGEGHGLSGREARVLAAVGRLLALRPELEERIAVGRVSLDAAASLCKVFETPGLIRENDDWLAWAEEWSAKELARLVRTRIVEAASGEAASAMAVILTTSGREKFERARQLACRKTSRLLSEGETVEVLSDHYLDSFDVDRRKPRKRRIPDTAGRPGRHVPTEVKRILTGRQGDRCAVPGCDHDIWLEKAHVHPHAQGGSREAGNLVYLCWQHHRMFDHGLLRLEGSPDRPVFTTPDGNSVGGSRAPP